MAARYTHYYDAFGEHVLRADLMRRAMRERAEAVAKRARGLAPVDEDGPHPGRYRDAFKVTTPIRELGSDARVVGRVSNDAPEAVYVEFGTATMDAQHVLRRALDETTAAPRRRRRPR